jgi:hypothetical protein
MMSWKSALRGFGIALLALGLPVAGAAISLQQVIDDGGYTTANGVTFSGFSVSITGALAGSLSAADLELVFDESSGSAGFSLTGPISAADGELGDVFLSFSVSSSQLIVGALLSAINVADGGAGALASVDELIRTGAGALLGLLSTSDTGGPGAGIFDDSLGFAGQTSIRVMKDILVDSSLLGGGPGGSARISFVSQTFQLVPEPGTFVLVLGGLAGVALGRRNRGAR